MHRGHSMKVGSSCKGCDHCEYEIVDDYGCYDPGYYCNLKECPYEEEDLNGYGVEE